VFGRVARLSVQENVREAYGSKRSITKERGGVRDGVEKRRMRLQLRRKKSWVASENGIERKSERGGRWAMSLLAIGSNDRRN